MSKQTFWRGFGIGAGIGAGLGLGAFIACDMMGGPDKRVVRLEKSLQIAKPVEEVFDAWVDLENLSDAAENIEKVDQRGDQSTWKIKVNGKEFRWHAQVEQVIPNQAIGWKSTSGLKHTGRVNFSPIGNDTLIHVVMNYAPPSFLMRPFARLKRGYLEQFIDKVLRDFKTSLEVSNVSGLRNVSGRIRPSAVKATDAEAATGTFGSSARETSVEGRYNPIDFPQPPERKG